VLVAVVAAAALTSAPAPAGSSGDCREKPGPRFDVKLSGKEAYQGDFVAGHYAHSYAWTAKFKRVRMRVTRCGGRLHSIKLQASNGTSKTSVSYREPDIVTQPGTCDSDFICPRGAHAAATEKGCRFTHSGTYKASVSLMAFFRDGPSIVISGGPDDPALRREEEAAQRAACGDTFRSGGMGVAPFRSEGLEWDIGGYSLAASAQTIPELARRVAAGRGAAASAPATTRERNSSDGKTAEKVTVRASVVIGDGDAVRNRFPDGF
jgi:hypothetical protein